VDTLVKHTRSTNSFYIIKKFPENCYGRFASVHKRAFSRMQISQPVLIMGVCLTRHLHRSSVFSGLCSLTESGYLVFYEDSVFCENYHSTERMFELTEKGAHALNSGLLFRKAHDEKDKDEQGSF
jgi:hypothetical protein